MVPFSLYIFSERKSSSLDDYIHSIRALRTVDVRLYCNESIDTVKPKPYACAVIYDGEHEIARWQVTLPALEDISRLILRSDFATVIAGIPPSPKRGDIFSLADVYASTCRLMD